MCNLYHNTIKCCGVAHLLRIFNSGGSRLDCEGRAPPPRAQNVFIFMQFSGKIGQIIGWRPPRELAPPSGKSWIHHCLTHSYLGEVLDAGKQVMMDDPFNMNFTLEVLKSINFYLIHSLSTLKIYICHCLEIKVSGLDT